jgi:hypothetical protein
MTAEPISAIHMAATKWVGVVITMCAIMNMYSSLEAREVRDGGGLQTNKQKWKKPNPLKGGGASVAGMAVQATAVQRRATCGAGCKEGVATTCASIRRSPGIRRQQQHSGEAYSS